MKVYQQRVSSQADVEQPFANDIRYIYPENGAQELVVAPQIWMSLAAVDEALEKLGISQRNEYHQD